MARSSPSRSYQNPADEDELFFDMLRDEFSFFYALTVAVMDVIKSARDDQPSSASEDPRDSSS